MKLLSTFVLIYLWVASFLSFGGTIVIMFFNTTMVFTLCMIGWGMWLLLGMFMTIRALVCGSKDWIKI